MTNEAEYQLAMSALQKNNSVTIDDKLYQAEKHYGAIYVPIGQFMKLLKLKSK